MAHWFTGLSYSQIAAKIGSSEQHIVDSSFGALSTSVQDTVLSDLLPSLYR